MADNSIEMYFGQNTNIEMYFGQNTDIEIQDIFKYLYQMCFGCEHMVNNYSTALEWIKREMETATEDDLPDVEMLGDKFCRVHLKLLRKSGSPEQLTELFVRSAQRQEDGMERLEQELQNLVRLAREGRISFTEKDVITAIDEWKKLGFPAIHHSERFREAHHPAYRVIKQEYLCELK